METTPKEPSSFDLIYWLIEDNTIQSDVIFQFLDIFWPTFITKGKYIFLKDQYSEKKLKDCDQSKENVEYWMNLFTVDCFFSREKNGEKKASKLAKTLVEIWEMKLKKDFPSKKFIIKYLFDNETGDYGLTFYQDF